MKIFYVLLVVLFLSGCEPDDLICGYRGHRTKKDNMNRCYYTNDVGQVIYVDNSYCDCLF